MENRLILVVFLIVACSSVPYDTKLQPLIGKSKLEIIETLGVPDKTVQITDTTEILEWASTRNTFHTRSWWDTASTKQKTHVCTVDLTLINGTVNKYAYKGNDCK